MFGLFTTHTGKMIILPLRTNADTKPSDRPADTPSGDCELANPFDNSLTSQSLQVDGSKGDQESTGQQLRQVAGVSCVSTSPPVEIVSRKDLPNHPVTPVYQHRSISLPATPGPISKCKADSSLIRVNFVYNEYGELVDEALIRQHQTTDQLTVTQILRLIKKQYHHEVSCTPIRDNRTSPD